MQTNNRRTVNGLRAAAAMTAVGLMSAAGQAQSSWNTTDGLWSTQFNWIGGLPGLLDDVFIGDRAIAENSVVTLDIEEFVNSLQISNGMTLETAGRQLRVSESLDIFGRNQVGNTTFVSTLRVEAVAGNGIGVSTGNLRIDGGGLDTRLNSRTVVSDTLQLLSDDAVILNRGTIELTGDGTVLANNGEISAFSIHSRIEAPNGFLDLDGTTGNGVVRASTQDLEGSTWGHTFVARGLSDPFDGQMTIAGKNFVDMQLDESWVLGQNGELRFRSGSFFAPAPTLRGSEVRIEGNVVSSSIAARISADAIIAPTAELEVFDAVSSLRFAGNTVIEGGSFRLQSDNTKMMFLENTILQGGDFEAVDGAHFDFRDLTFAGGADFDGEVRVAFGADVVLDSVINATDLRTGVQFDLSNGWRLTSDLTVNAEHFGNSEGVFTNPLFIGRNGFNAATWTVNLPEDDSYSISGDIEIDHFPFGGGTTSIAGSDVAISGDVTISGMTRFDARVDLVDNSIFISNGSLEFAGGTHDDANTLDSVIFVSDDTVTLEAGEGVAVEGSAFLDGVIDFASGSALIATQTDNGSSLFLTGEVQSMGTLGTRGDDASLIIYETYDTSVGDVVVLDDGEVIGSEILNTNDTGVRGRGAIGIAVDNDTLIAAEGGRLTIDNAIDDVLGYTQSNDLDGSSNQGELHALNGSMTIVNESGDFHGTIRIASPHDLTLDGTALNLASSSVVDMRGGTIISDQLQTFGGELRASETAARLETDALFLSGSINKISSSLVLTQDTAIRAGAQFGNGGTLFNTASGELTLFDGAAIGIDVNSSGVINLGDAILDGGLGDAMIADDLFLSGTLLTDLAGKVAPLYDQLAIADTLTVRNAIFDVSYLNGFMAQAGDEFDILDFTTFEDLGYTLLLPELEQGLFWDSSDFETLGIIRVQVPAPGGVSLLLACGLVTTRRRRGTES